MTIRIHNTQINVGLNQHRQFSSKIFQHQGNPNVTPPRYREMDDMSDIPDIPEFYHKRSSSLNAIPFSSVRRITWTSKQDYQLIESILINIYKLIDVKSMKLFWDLIKSFLLNNYNVLRNIRQVRDRFSLLFHRYLTEGATIAGTPNTSNTSTQFLKFLSLIFKFDQGLKIVDNLSMLLPNVRDQYDDLLINVSIDLDSINTGDTLGEHEIKFKKLAKKRSQSFDEAKQRQTFLNNLNNLQSSLLINNTTTSSSNTINFNNSIGGGITHNNNMNNLDNLDIQLQQKLINFNRNFTFLQKRLVMNLNFEINKILSNFEKNLVKLNNELQPNSSVQSTSHSSSNPSIPNELLQTVVNLSINHLNDGLNDDLFDLNSLKDYDYDIKDEINDTMDDTMNTFYSQ